MGDYHTVWLEDNGLHYHADLHIRRHSHNTSIFKLTWENTAAGIFFEGTGMLVGELLVGAYWD